MDVDLMNAARSSRHLHHGMPFDAQIDDYLLQSVTIGKSNVLHIAGKSGNKAFAEELVLNINSSTLQHLLLQPNVRGDTPIHCAANAGKADFVRFLVSKTDELVLEKKNNHGDTALALAVNGHSTGHLEVVKILVERHERLGSEMNGSCEFPVYIAAERGSLEVLDYLLKFPHFQDTGPNGKTALHVAVARSTDRYLRLLLKERPGLLVIQDNEGSTPLHFIASCGDQRMANMLLFHGRPESRTNTTHLAHICDRRGMSPLHVASLMGHIEVMKEILKSRPDAFELVDRKGKSFLHLAVKHKRIEVVKFAIKTEGLKEVFNQQDDEGNTPLHLAVQYRHLSIVKALLKEKEVVGVVRNFNGFTPLDLAASDFRSSKMEHRMFEIIKSLIYSKAEFSARRLDCLEDVQKIKKQQEEQEEEEASRCRSLADNLTIVSVLVATVTFAAAFTLPGGYTEEGKAILTNRVSFKTFLITNTLAMVTSMAVTYLLVQTRSQDHDIRMQSIETSKGLMKISIGLMAMAFGTGTYVVIQPRSRWLAYLILVMASTVPLTLYTIKTWPVWYKKAKKKINIFAKIFARRIWKTLKEKAFNQEFDHPEIRIGRWRPSFEILREKIKKKKKISQWKPSSMTYFHTPVEAPLSYRSRFPLELQTHWRSEKTKNIHESGDQWITIPENSEVRFKEQSTS